MSQQGLRTQNLAWINSKSLFQKC